MRLAQIYHKVTDCCIGLTCTAEKSTSGLKIKQLLWKRKVKLKGYHQLARDSQFEIL